jgi:hypothetical protein
MNRAAHFDAVKAAIPAPVAAHDTAVPLVGGQVLRSSYTVLHDMGVDGAPEDDRYTKAQSKDSAVTYRYVVKSVGVTPFAARSVDDAVGNALIGKALTVQGRTCEPLRLDDSGQVEEDRTVSPPLYVIESDYLLTSKAATA